jgi:hypothetical protein
VAAALHLELLPLVVMELPIAQEQVRATQILPASLPLALLVPVAQEQDL